MKEFENRVRWQVKIEGYGYGKNIREALLDYAARLQHEVIYEFTLFDLEAMENEVCYIDTEDTDDAWEYAHTAKDTKQDGEEI